MTNRIYVSKGGGAAVEAPRRLDGGAPTDAFLRENLDRMLEDLKGASAELAGSATRVARAARDAAATWAWLRADALADVSKGQRGGTRKNKRATRKNKRPTRGGRRRASCI